MQEFDITLIRDRFNAEHQRYKQTTEKPLPLKEISVLLKRHTDFLKKFRYKPEDYELSLSDLHYLNQLGFDDVFIMKGIRIK